MTNTTVMVILIGLLLTVLVRYGWRIVVENGGPHPTGGMGPNKYLAEQEHWFSLWAVIARYPEKHRIRIRNAINVARYNADMEMKATLKQEGYDGD